MTYVVDEKCIKCKTTDCVAVCPVNCFYERASPRRLLRVRVDRPVSNPGFASYQNRTP